MITSSSSLNTSELTIAHVDCERGRRLERRGRRCLEPAGSRLDAVCEQHLLDDLDLVGRVIDRPGSLEEALVPLRA